MYKEITCDKKEPLIEAASEQIRSGGVPCLMRFRQWGDFYVLSINEGAEDSQPDESRPA